MINNQPDDEKQALNPIVTKVGLFIFLGIPLLILLYYFLILILGMLGIIEPEGV